MRGEQMKHLNNNYVLHYITSNLSSKEVAIKLGISKRYVNKLREKYNKEGPVCLEHKNKGKLPKSKTPIDIEKKIISLYKDKYDGFNFVHFKEKLKSDEKIEISYKAVYRILTSSGFISPKAQNKKKKDNIHPLRDRRKTFGELLQIDASIHKWFKGSTLKYALHGAIDDATGIVMGLYFDDEETLNGYYHMLERIILNYGIPKTFYTDKRTVFTYNKLSDKDKTIENNTNIQFKRCCSQLGVEIITTSIPQAKGRIERLWGTLQSRLLNELALNNITNIKDANKFLVKFEREFNKKFAFDLKDFDSSFTPWNKTKEELSYYLSTQYQRVIDNGSSFSLDCNKYCLVDDKHKVVIIPPKTKVNVFKTLSEKTVAVYNEKYYETKLATASKKHKIKPIEFKVENKPKWKPSPDHPWRRYAISCG